MKKLAIVLLLLVSINFVFAQKFPDQVHINYKGSSIFLQAHQDFQYSTDQFVLGWHWWFGKYSTKSLGMRFIHCPIQEWDELTNNYNTPIGLYRPDLYADSCRMIIRSNWIGGWNGWNPKDARALHYIPTLQENEMKDTTVDARNGFIGFKNISPTSRIDGQSLYLDSNITNSGLVLSENLLAGIFFQLINFKNIID